MKLVWVQTDWYMNLVNHLVWVQTDWYMNLGNHLVWVQTDWYMNLVTHLVWVQTDWYITYTRVFTAIFINVNLSVIAWPNCTEMSLYQRSYIYVTWFTHLHFIAKHTNTNWTNTYIRVLREEVNVNDSEQRESFLEVVHYVKQPIAGYLLTTLVSELV